MAFHPDGVGKRRQRVRELLDDADGARLQLRAAARKQDIGADLHFDPEVRTVYEHQVLLHQVVHRVLDFVRYFLQGGGGCGGGAGGRIRLGRFRSGDLGVAGGFRQSGLYRHWREHRARLAFQHGLLNDRGMDVGAGADLLLANLNRLHGARRAAEGGEQRIRQHSILAFVDLGDCVHDDEECEQQG